VIGLLALLLVAWPAAAPAIVIQSAADPAYVTGSARFTGVVEIRFHLEGQDGAFLCSGSLISSVHVLTAGHCLDGASDWTVTFETAEAEGRATVGTRSAALHPDFRLREEPFPTLAEYDVGILTIQEPAPPGAARYGLERDLTSFVPASPFTSGTLLDVVGYGHARQAVVNVGHAPDQVLVMALSFGFAAADRGLANGGDSGGPALLGDDVLGVASFSSLPRPGTGEYASSVVPYLSGYESLADPLIGSWVAGFVETAAVPWPWSFLLLIAAWVMGVRTLLLRRAGGRTGPLTNRARRAG
jgi:hypothetical protein